MADSRPDVRTPHRNSSPFLDRRSLQIGPHAQTGAVDHLVPALQERGIYPTEYAGRTLRENLGLAAPVRAEAAVVLDA